MSQLKHRRVEEQVIVITGASSGIGLATAQAAAARGAKLVLTARNGETLQQVAQQLSRGHCEAVAVPADVASRAALQRVADEALARFGRIDTWVNDAGVSIYGRLDQVEEEDGRRLFDVNFWGVVHGSLVALPYLRASGGALVNVGSELSEAVLPLQGLYTASKQAVKGFTDTLRVELEELDRAPVTITLIQPIAVDTPLAQHARNYMDREPRLPTPQIVPEKVAEAILKAAEEGGRDIRVGTVAVVDTVVTRLLPAMADKLAARQAERQQYDEPPRHPEGTLFQPGGEGRVHGAGGLRAS